MKWNTTRAEIFLINSKEEGICPCCGSPLKYRDSRKRVHKIAGGGKEWYLIRRLRCSSDKCGRLHNELPDCLCPYKHYDAGLIEDVVDGVVSEEDTETEDYPCEGTMKHWRWWLHRNEKNIEGQIRAAAHRFLDLDGRFLKSRASLLEEMKERISPGWLKAASRAIYNQQAYEAIRQRIDMNIMLGRLDRAETGKYIAAHMAYAGAGKEIFTSGAEDEVYKISAGIPRMINRVCEKALMYACQQQKRLLDEHMVRFVADHEMLGGVG